MRSLHHIATSLEEWNKIRVEGLTVHLNGNGVTKNNFRKIRNIVIDFFEEKHLFVPASFRLEPAGSNPEFVIIKLTPRESTKKKMGIKRAVCLGCKKELTIEKGDYCDGCTSIKERQQDIKIRITALAQIKKEVYCLVLSNKIPTLWLKERDCIRCNDAKQNGGRCEVHL